jgi:glycosyltransferase involved in cell wall biosynthesis
MVHKGLDLVLEAFSKLPEYHLTVCGPVNKEPDFEKAYYKELYQTQNIKTLGFTDLRSIQFLEVIKKTSALVYPSCSEGGGGSVITGLHAGLIPIISYESSVDVEDFGILLEDCSVDGIVNSVRKCSQKSGEELEQMSKKAWQYARANHTREKFAGHYETFVKKITEGTG